MDMPCLDRYKDRPGPAAAYVAARAVTDADVYRTDATGDVVHALWLAGWLRDEPSTGR